VMAPKSVRIEAYKRLAADLDMKKLAAMSVRAKLDDVPHLANDIVAGKVRGRVIVDVNA